MAVDLNRQLYPRDGDGAVTVGDILDAGTSGKAVPDLTAITAVEAEDATDEATAVTLANETKAKFNALLAALKA